MVVDKRGYAEITCHPNEQPNRMTLQPWAKIEGTLFQSGKPVADTLVYLHPLRFSGDGLPRINDRSRARTDVEGRFVFPRVPPIKCRLMAELSVWEDSVLSSSQSLPLAPEPGQALTANLGQAGAEVTGRVTLQRDPAAETDLSFSLNYLLRLRPGVQPPAPVADFGFDWRNGWNDAWDGTPEGIAYRDSLHYFFVKLGPDGTFRISGVPTGDYELAFRIYEPPEGGCLVHPLGARRIRFHVPSKVSESPDGVLDLGTVSVEAGHVPKPGDLVPNICFETAEGERAQLVDYRGKYVFLDFWASWCGPCVAQLPAIRQFHARFGEDNRLVVIGMNLDKDRSRAKRFIKEHEITWSQGLLGDWTETDVPRQLGVDSAPLLFLIGPDGRLAHKCRHTDDMAAAIGRELLREP